MIFVLNNWSSITWLWALKSSREFIVTATDSEWCGAVNATVVKNVKDANVPINLLPGYAENTLMLYQDLATRKKFLLSFALHIKCILAIYIIGNN
mgnify:CR=1 FL=1